MPTPPPEGWRYVRFRSAAPNRHGRYPGVFALVNGLSRAGVLTAAQEELRRDGYAWYNRNLPDPTVTAPAVYDRERHPGAAAWFTSTATPMITRVTGYLDILDQHCVRWICLRVADPGTIIYADPYQVVARPPSA